MPDSLQKPEGTEHVGLNEVFGAVDAAIDVAFGGEVDDRARLVGGQQLTHQGCIANVGLDEHMAGIAMQAGQSVEVARVGEFVQVDHVLAAVVCAGEPVEYEIGTDKASAAGHKNTH